MEIEPPDPGQIEVNAKQILNKHLYVDFINRSRRPEWVESMDAEQVHKLDRADDGAKAEGASPMLAHEASSSPESTSASLTPCQKPKKYSDSG
jgi:hypothetical protein